MNIIFVDVLPGYLDNLLASRGYHVLHGHLLTDDEILEYASSADTGLIIRSRFAIDERFLSRRPHKIRFIARFGAGMENIDAVYCKSMGISCYHSPQGNCDAVADHALGLLLSITKRIAKSFFEVKNGTWLREENRGWELDGKTIAILGFGNTGSRFAKRLSGFDCEVLAYDKYLAHGYAAAFPNVRESDMDTIFEKADVLSLHLPLTNETRGLVKTEFLEKFQKPICLINTSRGKIVDTRSVFNMLQNGKLTGFGADVLDAETVSFELLDTNMSPVLSDLLASDRVVITPHIAGWSFESNFKMSDILAAQICRDFPAI